MDWQRGWVFLKRLRESRQWITVVNIVLALTLIMFVGRYLLLDWRQVRQATVALNLSYVGVALGLYGLNFVLFIIAWRGIVIRFGGPPDWKQNVCLYSYTNLAKFLPTPAWFLASRIHLYGQSGMGRRAALATTAVETLLHASAGLAFYALLATNPERPVTWPYMLALIPVAVMLSRPDWLELRWISGGRGGTSVRRQDVIVWVASYFLTWVVAGPFFWAVIGTFSGDVPPLSDLWRIWTLSGLVSYVATYTLGGVGILREFALTWLLGKFYPLPLALLIAVGVRLTLIGGGVLWGLTASGFVHVLSRVKVKVNSGSKGDE